MAERNVIEQISRLNFNKSEVIDMIEKNYPNEETHATIGVLTTTTMTDGTVMQSIMFGKPMQ